nr:hypothetical protein Iba_scaffold9196CG0080 [Ipomoea batatas]
MVTLPYTCPKPNTMMIKLENTFVTILTVFSSWGLHGITVRACHRPNRCSMGVHIHHELCPRCRITI